MLELLARYANQLFLYGFSLEFRLEREGYGLKMKMKDFMLKDDETSGFIVEDLVLDVLNIKEREDPEKIFRNASYIVEKLSFMLSEEWVREIISSDEEIEEHGIKKLDVDFISDMLSVSGEFHVGVNFSASVDLKIIPEDGMLRVDFDRFWAMEKISLPKFLQNALMKVAKKYLTSRLPKGVTFSGNSVIVDYLSMIPFDCYFEITDVFIRDRFLVIRGGADLAKSRKAIAEKEKRKKEAKKKKTSDNLPGSPPDSLPKPESLAATAGIPTGAVSQEKKIKN
jgi:hypothetical protein